MKAQKSMQRYNGMHKGQQESTQAYRKAHRHKEACRHNEMHTFQQKIIRGRYTYKKKNIQASRKSHRYQGRHAAKRSMLVQRKADTAKRKAHR